MENGKWKIGILCGLKSEKRVASKIPNSVILCSGSNPYVGDELAEELAERGADFLMSFGVAGALSPYLHAGNIVIGEKVVSSSGNRACDEDTVKKLLSALPEARMASVYGSDKLVSSPSEKKKIYSDTGCHIVDMESQCVAKAAAKHNIPFIAVRAVCDGVKTQIPDSVINSVRSDGSVDVMQTVNNILAKPMDIFRLLPLAISMYKAYNGLNIACKTVITEKIF
ncbi:MAG: hypothetical protein FWE93_06600 [Alphaproteobacteria bacterium]|nr:hypothetical protein [Alphaproteobacteria bacterium]